MDNMAEEEDLDVQISRLLEHFKIKPSVVVLNTIFIALKNYGYKDIPRLQFDISNILSKETILNYCKEIKELIENEPEKEDQKKKSSSKDIHIFQESTMLPQNVYVSEKGDEEKLEDIYIEDNVTTATESENSADSELEQEEEGYEIYEENDSEEFSE
jgi:hypothetical protein